MARAEQPLLELRGITKTFPGVRALDQVDLAVFPGEVLALIGENGAGKSTLMNVLGGVLQPDEGSLFWQSQPLHLQSVADSLARGIAFVHQELSDLDNLDVAANIWLGREPRKKGLMDRARMVSESLPLLERLGLEVDPRTRVDALSIGQRQLVEIARALSMNARLVIMDEPTSSLTLTETERLLQVISSLKKEGIAVIYISHRLSEIGQCADRVTALRDGKNSGDLERAAISHEAMIRLMIGRDLVPPDVRTADSMHPGRLKIENLQTRAWPKARVSLTLDGGKILGLAGLIGAGRSEMARALFGVDARMNGSATLDGEPILADSPRAALRQGLFLVPEDRKAEGLILDFSIGHNITLPVMPRFAGKGLVDFTKENAYAQEHSDALGVKAPSVQTQAGALSGGNQQKIVLARWLALGPRVLILDEPTRGVDVGAKAEIYDLIYSLAEKGVAVLVISSDMEELLMVSDEVAVMCEGHITGRLDRKNMSEESILKLAVPRNSRQELSHGMV